MVNTYGLIVYYEDPPTNDRLYHLVQRRDTLAYIHFLRGKVEDHKISKFLDLMTAHEKYRLQNYHFDDLWKDLHSQVSIVKDEYYRQAYDKFSKFPLETINNSKSSIELEWVLPKGRKKHREEPDLVCAFREYREETKNRSYLEFLNVPPIINNTIHGIQTYYIAKSKYQPIPRYYYLDTVIKRATVSEETNDVKWSSLDTAKKLLNADYSKVLTQAHTIINENQTFLSLQDAITQYCPRSFTT